MYISTCWSVVATKVRLAPKQSASAAQGSQQSPDELTPVDLRFPSTGGLQILMQQAFLRESFRSFVKQSWIPALHNEAQSNEGVRALALNSLDFLTDVRDFNMMQNNSLFQSYRACHIFEKYIMHGSVQQVISLYLNALHRKRDQNPNTTPHPRLDTNPKRTTRSLYLPT
jgi:hypothetical protein